MSERTAEQSAETQEKDIQEEQTGNAQEEEAQEEQSEKKGADIVLFCHPNNVQNLVQAFEAQIGHTSLPAFVLWSGQSGLHHMGVIVLEWDGIVSEGVESLSANHS